MKKAELTPAKLRIILIVALVTLVGAHVFATFVGQRLLARSSEGVTRAVTLSHSSQKTLDTLASAEQQLDSQESTVKKAGQLVAVDSSYQDQVIKDITNYAQLAGMQVRSFSFESAAPAAGAAANTAQAAPTAVAGTTSERVTISLVTPISYSSLLRFLQLVDGNVLQLKAESLNISTAVMPEEGVEPQVDTSTLTFEVYKKS